MNDEALLALIQDIQVSGPSRVVIDTNGQATTPGRTQIKPDVIFIRGDGWSLGAPQRWEKLAEKMWADEWVAVMTKQEDSWDWRRWGDVKYPMSEKLSDVSEKSQAIGEFLEWLGGGEADDSGFERPITLGAYRVVVENSRGKPLDEEVCHVSDEDFIPHMYSTQALLAKFFGIDLGKLEKERRAMLEELNAKR